MQQKDIDKLIRQATRKTDRSISKQDNVLTFLEFYNIKSGRTWVRYGVLKKLYYLWSKEPINTEQLKTLLGQYLPFHLTKGYRINYNSVKLTKKAFEYVSANRIPVIRQKQIHNFLRENKIETGSIYLSSTLIYKLFKYWCKRRKLIPVAEDKFINLLKIFLSYKITEERSLYFGVNSRIDQTLTRQKKIER